MENVTYIRDLKRLLFLFVFCIIFFFSMYNVRFVVVSGDSMSPTLCDGEIVYAQSNKNLEYDGVYVIKVPDVDAPVVKRLIGMPGDQLEFKSTGEIYRNGILYRELDSKTVTNMVVTLGYDEYFFLGDNIDESYDSRYWGRPAKFEEIQYKLQFVIFPFFNFRAVW